LLVEPVVFVFLFIDFCSLVENVLYCCFDFFSGPVLVDRGAPRTRRPSRATSPIWAMPAWLHSRTISMEAVLLDPLREILPKQVLLVLIISNKVRRHGLILTQ
jgi:hypothetical protein